MRSLRRTAATLIVGSLGAAAFALAGSGPAAAATPAISFASPSAPGTVLNQAPLILQGDVFRDGGFVDSISVTVTWSDTVKGRVPGAHPPSTVRFTPSSRQADAPWTFQPSMPYNGTYTVTVLATSDGGGGTSTEQATASSTFVADLPPAVPTRVVATRDDTERVTHLSWAANPEPDTLGYWIIRAGPSADDAGHIIGGVDVPQTTFTDDQVATEPPGSYRYEVLAVRANGAGNSLDVSSPSQEVAATFTTPAKAVAPSPPPTTVAPGPSTTLGPTSGATGTSGVSGASGTPVTTGAVSGPQGTPVAPTIVLPPATNSLPTYQALLNQAKQTTVTTEPPDPGFSASLPYQRVTHTVVTVPAAAPPALLGAPDQTTNAPRRTIEFLAASLILAVLAMFGLVLKRSAEHAGVLEALTPAAAPDPAPAAPSRLSMFLAAAEGAPADGVEAEPALQTRAVPPDLRLRLGQRSARVAAALASEPSHPPAAPEAPQPAEATPAAATPPEETASAVAPVPVAQPLVAAPEILSDHAAGGDVDLVDDVAALPSRLLLVIGGAPSDDLVTDSDDAPARPAPAGAQPGYPERPRPLQSPWRA